MSHEAQELQISERHVAWLNEMADKHGLPDHHKALRVVLEYAMQDGDQDDIFVEIRCANC